MKRAGLLYGAEVALIESLARVRGPAVAVEGCR
jgi:hypothetical protein